MSALEQLQTLLRELFQLDLADLDFGIYRLFRIKRDEIEAFLNEQLPRRAAEAFQAVADEERAALEREVEDLAPRIRREVADDALSAAGEPQPSHPAFQARLARELLEEYVGKRRALQGLRASEAQQAEVFNHLYAFFSRYYESGDFIPRRRYGAREAYAVPYNGEEVLFHWANKDQHYVKTAEALRDYAFTVEALGGPYRIRFPLTGANLPPGNTKGEARYFFPLPKEAEWEADKKTFRLPFHYRLPTEAEVEQYGRNSRLQEAVRQGAERAILRAVPVDLLRSALAMPVDPEADPPVSLLLKRLRHFTRRQTSDYFIHRDLRGFLTRELEFYLKDQVLHLGDLEGDLEAKCRMLRVLRTLAGELIEFLAQIEDVQKRLFEKRKFVLRTDYLAPIQNVPRDLWPEVVANPAQVQAWKDLFAIEPRKDLFNRKGEVNLAFLEEHPTLVVDTAHFGPDFTERLLAAFDDLDEATDGLLIHSENYQALRLLQPKYGGRVRCVYIDPPYNTGSDGFIYRDRYQQSSWLAMISERLELSRTILAPDAITFVSIDDNEVAELKQLVGIVYGAQNFIASIVWRKMFSPKSTAKHFSVDHDYLLAFGPEASLWRPQLLPRTEGADARYENPDDDPRGPWTSGDLTARNYYSQGKYSVTSPSGRTFQPAVGTYWRVNHERFKELDYGHMLKSATLRRRSRSSLLSSVFTEQRTCSTPSSQLALFDAYSRSRPTKQAVGRSWISSQEAVLLPTL
jgi:adenine-specific DNA-methyltransferase